MIKTNHTNYQKRIRQGRSATRTGYQRKTALEERLAHIVILELTAEGYVTFVSCHDDDNIL